MNIEVTINSFDDQMAVLNPLIPSIKPTMEKLVAMLIHFTEPPIDISGLNTIHFVDNYPAELFGFQESVGHSKFVTDNKIATGHAQVVHVLKGQGKPEQEGYHIFISKFITGSIIASQIVEDIGNAENKKVKELQKKKNNYIRVLLHELGHVEDYHNQDTWDWLIPAFKEHNLQTSLRFVAQHLWAEYYACKRSNFIHDADTVAREVDAMLSSLEAAEKEICELRWKYNILNISLEDFVEQFYDYIRLAFTFGCYFMGHMDRIYDHIIGRLHCELYPSRFYKYFPQLWDALRKMAMVYPNWKSPEIYDEVANIILQSIEEFDVIPEQIDDEVYYHIPVRKLTTRLEEVKKNGI